MNDSFTKKESESEQSVSDIINTAMRHLTRREHSRLELTQKLHSIYSDSHKITSALNQVCEKGYLSDERYADLIVRSRINQYCGPFKMRMELRGKGVVDDIIESVIESYDVDWLSLARQARVKRYGESAPSDAKNLSKQIRYLKNKGFYQEHIERVVSLNSNSNSNLI